MPSAGLQAIMIKAVILDFYGVIQTDNLLLWVDHHNLTNPSFKQTFDDICRRLDMDEINLDEYYNELADAVHRPVEVVRAELAAEVVINRDLLAIVDQIRSSGIKVAVLSNDGSSLRTYIDDLGLTHYFDLIVVSAEVRIMKPDARIYQHAAHLLGLPVEECIFFDDRQTNVDGALRAGMQSELFTSNVQVRNILDSLV